MSVRVGGSTRKSNKKKFFTSTDWAGYVFSAPLVIGVLVFAIYPMIGALILSFQKLQLHLEEIG